MNRRKASFAATLLDDLWSLAPFASYPPFMAAVTRTAAAWQKAGRFSAEETKRIIEAAAKAEREVS